jgi:hypothetical protein
MKIFDDKRNTPVNIEAEVDAVVDLLKQQWDCTGVLLKDVARIHEDPVRFVVKEIFDIAIEKNKGKTSWCWASSQVSHFYNTRRKHITKTLEMDSLFCDYDAPMYLIQKFHNHITNYNDSLQVCSIDEVSKHATKKINGVASGLINIKPTLFAEFLEFYDKDSAAAEESSEILNYSRFDSFNGHSTAGATAGGIFENGSLADVAYCLRKGITPAETFVSNIVKHAQRIGQYNNECAIVDNLRCVNFTSPFSNELITIVGPSLQPIIDSIPNYTKAFAKLTESRKQDILHPELRQSHLSAEEITELERQSKAELKNLWEEVISTLRKPNS